MPSNPLTVLTEKPEVVTSGVDRLFPFLLLGITLAALVPALVLGSANPTSAGTQVAQSAI